MDLAKFGLRRAPPFVSGYTEFTSFSARINEHDGTTDRGNKTLGASIMSIPKFHKYSQAKADKATVLEESQIAEHFNSVHSIPPLFKTIVGNRLRVANLVGKKKYSLAAYADIVSVVGQCGGSVGKEGDHTG